METTISNATIEAIKNMKFAEEINHAVDNRTLTAIATVVTYTLTDAFDLVAEESIWVGWHVQEILQPLKNEHPEGLQVAVKQELETFVYSNALFERSQNIGAVHTQNEKIKYASKDDWTEAITEIIFASYPDLRPMLHARIVGSISGLLEELGVTNGKNSRASLYLPNALRYIIQNKQR